MKFKILGFKRRNTFYEYIVKGDKPYTKKDLIPFMQEISNHSERYKLETTPGVGDDTSDLRIVVGNIYRATISLESTLFPTIKKIHVQDEGVGKQMIDKYVRSIEGRN